MSLATPPISQQLHGESTHSGSSPTIDVLQSRVTQMLREKAEVTQRLQAENRQLRAERDRYKGQAAQTQRRLSQLTTLIGCPDLTGESVRRIYAGVTVAEVSGATTTTWGSINSYDLATVAGIGIRPKDDSEEERKRATRNAMTIANRAASLIVDLGILEKGEPIYYRDDPTEPNKITGCHVPVRFRVPPNQALTFAASHAPEKQPRKPRGIHVEPIRCPHCGSADHIHIKCSDCGHYLTGDEWVDSKVQELEAQHAAVDDAERPESHVLQNLQAENTVNHSLPVGYSTQNLQHVENGGEGSESPWLSCEDDDAIPEWDMREADAQSFGLLADQDEDLLPLPEEELSSSGLNSTDAGDISPLEPRPSETASEFAIRQGWHVFPVWWPEHGRCACGYVDCTDEGKHPVTDVSLGLINGCKSADADPIKATRRWGKYPKANTGINAGASGLFIVEVDQRGKHEWQALEQKHGRPNTFTVESGSGGWHFYFKMPKGRELSNAPGDLPPGIDVRGKGGYVVGPMSLHKTGRQYCVINSSPIADVPPWLLTLICPPTLEKPRVPMPAQVGRFYTTGSPVPEGSRETELARVAGGMLRRGASGLQLEELVEETNENRCRPPLPWTQARKIARSVEATAQRRSGEGGL